MRVKPPGMCQASWHTLPFVSLFLVWTYCVVLFPHSFVFVTAFVVLWLTLIHKQARQILANYPSQVCLYAVIHWHGTFSLASLVVFCHWCYTKLVNNLIMPPWRPFVATHHCCPLLLPIHHRYIRYPPQCACWSYHWRLASSRVANMIWYL